MARLLVVLLTPPTALCLSGVFSTGGDKIAVQPVKLLRLLNSVYASDNLLLFGREEEPDRLLPTLLAFDQASALEAELGGFGPGMFGSLDLTGKLLARVDFFEAALNRAHGPFELARRARQATGVADAMARALDEGGLQPTSCLLGSAMEEQELGTVGMRDMGANTPAAPSSVRLTAQLPATLLCGGDGGVGRRASLPLGGAADAVLLARRAARSGLELPLLVSPSLWALRAVVPSRLPESIAEQDCSLEECRVP